MRGAAGAATSPNRTVSLADGSGSRVVVKTGEKPLMIAGNGINLPPARRRFQA
jgi:hypothetical protein